MRRGPAVAADAAVDQLDDAVAGVGDARVVGDDEEGHAEGAVESAHEGEDCPGAGVFDTDQIVDVDIRDRNASFRDLNSNDPRTIAYSWFFSCDDPAQKPDFDPVIENGGGNN